MIDQEITSCFFIQFVKELKVKVNLGSQKLCYILYDICNAQLVNEMSNPCDFFLYHTICYEVYFGPHQCFYISEISFLPKCFLTMIDIA